MSFQTAAPLQTATDVIISAVEINDRHGVGILVKRIFQERSKMISLRTYNLYDGDHLFSMDDRLLDSMNSSRAEIFSQVKQILAGQPIERVLCIPYHPSEAYMALAIHELFGAQVCTYLMDDRNILVNGIADELMAELLAKSNLRLAISPEMCDVYATKYRQEIYFVPPVISAEIVNDTNVITDVKTESMTALHQPVVNTYQAGAAVGNIWSAKWLRLLRNMTKTAKVQLDWYGNTGADWNMRNRAELINDGICEKGFLPTELELARVIRTYPYVVVPSGTLDERDDNQATSWLSLPSRIPFILTATNTPIIVLGNRNTAAARFVERLGIGTVSDYDPVSFQQAVAYVTEPSNQLQLRLNALQIADTFINRQMDEWIWQSLAIGEPIDDRFEKISTNKTDYLTALVTCMNSYRQQWQQQKRERDLIDIIISMQETKFWKLRKSWFRLKRWLKLTDEPDDPDYSKGDDSMY